MNKEERITYEEFMVMFRNAPKFVYMLYDKAENEIERLNNIIAELEKYIIHREELSWDDNGAYDDILDKLKELKEKSDIE